jgi:WD40 repeat protein
VRRSFLLLVFVLAGCGLSGHAGTIDARNAHELVVSEAPAGSSAGGAAVALSGGGLRRVAPNGKWAIVAVARRPVVLRDAHSGATFDTLSPVAAPTAIGWSADSKTFAVGSRDGRISVWEEFRHRSFDLAATHTSVLAIALSPDTELVVATYADASLRVWDAQRHRQVARIRLPAPAARVRLAPDGQRILAGGVSTTWQLTLPR